MLKNIGKTVTYFPYVETLLGGGLPRAIHYYKAPIFNPHLDASGHIATKSEKSYSEHGSTTTQKLHHDGVVCLRTK